MKKTRSIWNGNITFETVTIPVRVHAVVQSETVRFKALHTCGCQIRQKTICPECGEIPRSETQHGYPAENSQFVTLTADELQACQPESGRVMKIEGCVSLRDIDPVLFHKAYYLEPGAEGMTTYSLLRQALKAEGKCALTRITLNRREHIAILRPWNSCLLLQTLFYTKEIQSAPEIVIPGRMIENAELSDLRALVDRSTGSFDHSRYRDRHQQAIRHLLQQKLHSTSREEADQLETKSPLTTVRIASACEAQPSASEQHIGPARMIHIYTGVAQDKDQPKRFAYAYHCIDESGNICEQVRVMEKCTSNRAELSAVIEVLKESPVGVCVVVYTTSTYVSGAGSNLSKSPLRVGKWTQKYRDGKISNAELWREYEVEATSRQVVMGKANTAQRSRLKSIAQAALLAA